MIEIRRFRRGKGMKKRGEKAGFGLFIYIVKTYYLNDVISIDSEGSYCKHPIKKQREKE